MVTANEGRCERTGKLGPFVNHCRGQAFGTIGRGQFTILCRHIYRNNLLAAALEIPVELPRLVMDDLLFAGTGMNCSL